MDISHQLEELNKELESVQNQIQTIIHTLQAEQNPLEQGEKYARHYDKGLSFTEVARIVKKDKQFVSDRIKLWKADPMLKKACEEGNLNLDRAKYIARHLWREDPRLQQALVKRVEKSPGDRAKITKMNKQELVELAKKSLEE